MSNQIKQSSIGLNFMKTSRGKIFSISVVILAMIAIAIGFNWS